MDNGELKQFWECYLLKVITTFPFDVLDASINKITIDYFYTKINPADGSDYDRKILYLR